MLPVQYCLNSGVNRAEIFAALKDIRGSQRITDQNPEEKYQALERYCKDLVELASKGKISTLLLGRDDEDQAYNPGTVAQRLKTILC